MSYSGKGGATSLLGNALALVAAGGACMMVPLEYSWTMPIFGVVATNVGRVPQIYNNFVNGHTGPLSFVTTFLTFAGAAARVFTTMQEVNDPFLLLGFVVSVGVNLTVMIQIITYSKATAAFLRDEKAKKAE